MFGIKPSTKPAMRQFRHAQDQAQQIRENGERAIFFQKLKLNDLLGRIEKRAPDAGVSSRSITVGDLKMQEMYFAAENAHNTEQEHLNAAFNVETEALHQLAQAHQSRIAAIYKNQITAIQTYTEFAQLGLRAANLAVTVDGKSMSWEQIGEKFQGAGEWVKDMMPDFSTPSTSMGVASNYSPMHSQTDALTPTYQSAARTAFSPGQGKTNFGPNYTFSYDREH